MLGNDDEVFYNYVQAAELLGEHDSTLRYWVSSLNDILKIDTTSTRTVRITKADLENLRYIKKLVRDYGYSLKQVRLYCGDMFDKDSKTINMDNQLQIVRFMDDLSECINRKMITFKDETFAEYKNLMIDFLKSQAQLNEDFKRELCQSMTDISAKNGEEFEAIKNKIISSTDKVSETAKKTNEILKETNTKLDNAANNMKEQSKIDFDKLDKYFDEINTKMDETNKKIEEVQKSTYVTQDQLKEYNKRGLFYKIFGSLRKR